MSCGYTNGRAHAQDARWTSHSLHRACPPPTCSYACAVVEWYGGYALASTFELLDAGVDERNHDVRLYRRRDLVGTVVIISTATSTCCRRITGELVSEN